MGSFNVQCFASKQVIAEGELCRVAVIIRARSYNPVELMCDGKAESLYGISSNECYADAFWKLETGFLQCEYDDYGKFNLLETPHNRRILAVFFADLFKRSATAAVGQNATHEPSFDFKKAVTAMAPRFAEQLAGLQHFLAKPDAAKMDWQEVRSLWSYFCSRLQQNRVFLPNGGQVLQPLAFAVLHEQAYKALINTAETLGGHKFGRKSYFTEKLKELSAELAKEEDAELKPLVQGDFARDALRRIGLNVGVSPILNVNYREVICATAAYFDEGPNLEALLDRLAPLLDDLYAVAGLGTMNICFAPLLTAGQDYANAAGQMYAKFVVAASTAVTKGRIAAYKE